VVEGVRALRERGFAPVVVVPYAGPLAELLAEAGAETRVARYSSWVSPRDDGTARRAKRTAGHLVRWPGLVALIRREAPDVVMTNTLCIPGGALAAWAAGVPHVWFVHEFGDRDHGIVFDFGIPASVRLVNRLSNRVLVASRAVHDYFEGPVSRGKLRRVRLAVELPPGLPETEPPAGEGPLELAMVAQKSVGKRQEDAVRAVALLAGRGIEARLSMVGREDPAYGARLRALVRELGVEDRVRILPFAPAPMRYVTEAHAALVCSRMEAMGRATVEAMKLGRPVVGAASGGTAELVRDGWNGLLYPPGDAAALANALERLHHDRLLLREMGHNARRWALDEFNRGRYGDDLAAAIEEAIGDGPLRTARKRAG
jgi:glycosyltransferase involved in cell wall biosynthesis